MELVLNEDQELIAKTALDFVAEHSPVSRFRVLDFLKIRQVLHVTEPVRIQLREALVKKLPQLAGRAAALQEPEVPPAAEPA